MATLNEDDYVVRAVDCATKSYDNQIPPGFRHFENGGNKVIIKRSAGLIMFAFRGTHNARNALQDLDIRMADVKCIEQEPAVKVHNGFLGSVEKLRPFQPDGFDKDTAVILITGHSLGGAMAAVYAMQVLWYFPQKRVRLVTFGAPRVGNEAFHLYMKAHEDKGSLQTVQFANVWDPVPRLPPKVTLQKFRPTVEQWYHAAQKLRYTDQWLPALADATDVLKTLMGTRRWLDLRASLATEGESLLKHTHGMETYKIKIDESRYRDQSRVRIMSNVASAGAMVLGAQLPDAAEHVIDCANFFLSNLTDHHNGFYNIVAKALQMACEWGVPVLATAIVQFMGVPPGSAGAIVTALTDIILREGLSCFFEYLWNNFFEGAPHDAIQDVIRDRPTSNPQASIGTLIPPASLRARRNGTCDAAYGAVGPAEAPPADGQPEGAGAGGDPAAGGPQGFPGLPGSFGAEAAAPAAAAVGPAEPPPADGQPQPPDLEKMRREWEAAQVTANRLRAAYEAAQAQANSS